MSARLLFLFLTLSFFALAQNSYPKYGFGIGLTSGFTKTSIDGEEIPQSPLIGARLDYQRNFGSFFSLRLEGQYQYGFPPSSSNQVFTENLFNMYDFHQSHHIVLAAVSPVMNLRFNKFYGLLGVSFHAGKRWFHMDYDFYSYNGQDYTQISSNKSKVREDFIFGLYPLLGFGYSFGEGSPHSELEINFAPQIFSDHDDINIYNNRGNVEMKNYAFTITYRWLVSQ